MAIQAHPKKTVCTRWHTSTENLIATTGSDRTIKVWDINNCDDPAITFQDIPDLCNTFRWSPDGTKIAACIKNKSMAIFDPRQESSCIKAGMHVGPRSQRLEWIDDESIISAGFDREAKRQWGAWDLRNLEQPLLLLSLIHI